MNTFQALILLGFIILAIVCCKADNKKKFNEQCEAHRLRNIEYAKDGNRRLLKEFGDNKFITYFGKDQYDLIKSNRDTKIVEMINK